MDRIEIAVTFQVVKEDRVREYAHSTGEDLGGGTLADAVAEAAVNPASAPLDTGYEIIEKKSVPTHGENKFVVTLTADVHDRNALIAEAKERYEACWFDSNWEPESLGEALYEVAVASNESPGNDQIGLLNIHVSYVVDFSLKTAPGYQGA